MIHGVEVRDLKMNSDERGILVEMIRKDWIIYVNPAMAYFSISHPSVIRAWHQHLRGQTDFFCVMSGMVRVVIYDDRENSPTKGQLNEIVTGEDNMKLIKIPGECWHGFKVIGNKPAVLINFPTKLYDYENPDEERLPPDTKKIPYDWGKD